jgi:hypothetical protein
VSFFPKLFICIVVFTGFAYAEDSSDPARVLDRFHLAAAQADSANYLSLLTRDMVFMGTDGSERWEGESFRNFVDKNFSAGRGWRYTSSQRNITTSPDGKTAWFDEALYNETLGQCRGSGVMLRTGEGWKIAQYNLSVPVPNVLVEQVVADIAAVESGGEAAVEETAVDSPALEAVAEAEPATKTSSDCRHKRHKTNRKAGC